jgi:glycosyltransferase involved in cell wall biosynthesis
MENNMRILVLEPYYGGSHKNFLDGLKSRLPFDFTFMTFPAQKWKWRMRLAAPYYARKLSESEQLFDRILCSSFVDVAAFRGLAPAWTGEVPLLTYFHENQFVYPVQAEDERDLHFFLTNVTTAFASDRIAFNSSYNMRTFVEGSKKLLRSSHDMRFDEPSEILEEKSRVIPPGIDFSGIDATEVNNRDQSPVVVWNHRWEHDKNPELFFKTLYKLDKEGLDFRLVVLGQSYRESPHIFEEAKKRLAHRLLQFGYAHSQEEYARWLKSCDIVISTAAHEFFGIAVVEAVRAGCRPLLPRRLSYPDLFPDEFLYDEGELLRRLRQLVSRKERLSQDRAVELTERFSWETVAPAFKEWIHYK